MTAPRSEHLQPPYDVAVIGGGLAGMCAAVALARQGKKVVVLEAGPRLGGRAQPGSDSLPFPLRFTSFPAF